jgi:lipopolysaccharide/colanic/teichoic acid biosynthesis glycosyltransferase
MYKGCFKNIIDFMLALVLTICFLPLMLFIAVLIKISSQGPVLFRQERGGHNGKYFMMMKFRSMAVDPEAEKKGFEPGSGMRVTGIGRILRKTKLDELPQLFNVLRGEMSLVGPRPEVRVYIELYPERWENVHQVKPGITDPASVKFRNEEELLVEADDPEKEYRESILPHKLDIYEDYVRTISLISDAKIILATIFVVLLK